MTNKVVFLDTQGWVATLNSRDRLHQIADSEWRRLGRLGYSVLLSDWIIAETGNGLARTPARQKFAELVRAVLSDANTRLVFVTAELLARALILYEQRRDKNWGLVDCVSFRVMQDAGVTEAFTNDEHFTQAGFQCLLPKP